MKPTITRKAMCNGWNSWGFSNRNAFINHDGTRSWCEDDKGFVYSFEALASGRDKSAPPHMRRLARHVAKDLKAEGGEG